MIGKFSAAMFISFSFVADPILWIPLVQCWISFQDAKDNGARDEEIVKALWRLRDQLLESTVNIAREVDLVGPFWGDAVLLWMAAAAACVRPANFCTFYGYFWTFPFPYSRSLLLNPFLIHFAMSARQNLSGLPRLMNWSSRRLLMYNDQGWRAIVTLSIWSFKAL